MKTETLIDPCRRARRLSEIGLSEISQIGETVRTLKAEGKQVISLGTGEPDFPTPAHVVDAAYKAAQDGQTKYTATAGTIDLRRAIAEKTARDCGFAPEASEIIVTTGAKQAIFNVNIRRGPSGCLAG